MQSENQGSVSKVTTNTLGATYQFQSWLRNNNYRKIEDLQGTTWSLQIESKQLPDPEDTRKGIWHVVILVSTVLSARALLRCGVLREESDGRLLKLIGERQIPIEAKKEAQLRSVEAARRYIAEEIENTRKLLNSENLGEVKRSLVGRWVDFAQEFR